MTDPDPRPARAAATDSAEPVTVADIAAFTARLARLRPPALGGDPAEHAALLAHKAELFARIADQHTRTDPARAQQAREIAERAHPAARHAADAHDTTNVKDLRSPSFPGWGISLSNTGEFRRASSTAGPDYPPAARGGALRLCRPASATASDGQQARYRRKLVDLSSALLAADQVSGEVLVLGSVEPVQQVQRSVDDPGAGPVQVELSLRTFANGLAPSPSARRPFTSNLTGRGDLAEDCLLSPYGDSR